MFDASPFWQNAFLVWSIVCVGWCAWGGWRTGVVRGALALGGLAVAVVAGAAAARAVPALIGGVIPLPETMTGLVAGAAAALLSFFAVQTVSAILFKKTAQQRSFILRLLYGSGGALLGAVFGAAIVWGSVALIRSVGAFAEGGVEVSGQADVLAQSVVKLKRSIEAGSTGDLVRSLDVMPEENYRLLEKSGRVIASSEALGRFVQFPDVEAVARDPRFVALSSDPEVNELARARKIRDLLVNPKVIAALNDPGLIARLKKIQLEAALDFALAQPTQPAPAAP